MEDQIPKISTAKVSEQKSNISIDKVSRVSTLKSRLPIDSGWAWVIVTVGFCLFAFAAGSYKSQGILLVEISEEFEDVSPTAVLWVFSLCNFVGKLVGPLNSFIVHKTSNRTVTFIGVIICSLSLICVGYLPTVTYMYFVYGILYGWAMGMIVLPCFTITMSYFEKRKALAVGIITSGSGIGTIGIPNLLRTAFDHLHFSAALLVYAGLALQLLVAAALLRPFSFYDRRRKPDRDENLSSDSNEEIKLEDVQNCHHEEDVDEQHYHNLSASDQPGKYRYIMASTGDLSGSAYGLAQTGGEKETGDEKPRRQSYNWRLILNPLMLMMGCSIMVYGFGTCVVYQCLPPLGKSRGVSKQFIADVLSVAGAVEVIARISNGLLADKKYISALTQYCICVFLASISAFSCAMLSKKAGITIMLLGMSSAGTSVYSLAPVVFSELLGKENVNPAMGLFFAYQAIAVLIGTFITGYIYESFEMWEPVYYYIGTCMLLGGSIPLPYLLYKYAKLRRGGKTSGEESSWTGEASKELDDLESIESA